MKRAGNLSHHHARRVSAVGQIVPVRRQHADTAIDQRQNAELLGHELTGEAAGVLNDDGSDAIALDAIQQCSKARPAFDGVSP